MKTMIVILLASVCLIIGTYPLAYLLADGKFGLLQNKSSAVVSNTWWQLGFYVHIVSGGAALTAGWAQFIRHWRTKYPQMHRLAGVCYILAASLSSLAAISIAPWTSTGWIAGLAFEILGLIWLIVTLQAWVSIRRRNLQQHSSLMIYSYSACCAAVTLRLWLPLLLLGLRLDFSIAYPIVAWLCWVPNLMVAHLIIRRSAAASP